ncbi:MAG: UDP-glucose 4-epimerase GalE [Candidatus Brocadia sp.]|jgi:UDP-galactose 4-epimerase (EC 5.1.3.2)|uniref:UDP-glucose 4-epimerase n=1 Tax=Candidatus Brocadia fulgida TaxID=380242 RepID=A0A0M2UWL1_9BACT|nr:MAG: UDPglucose 4-epimerase [Candidatus Brocadia fulgida]UJS21381.1 MAG: UDP-glucose 4-epimerase GalE [Candidatus Brocadia sp.]
MNNSDTVIVTGGAGYIGSHTIIELLEQTDYRVISLDNYSNSTEDTYRRIREITGKGDRLSWFKVDLCNKAELIHTLKPTDSIKGIIHFAAFKSVPESVADPLLYYHNNMESLVNILYLCREKKIRDFIFSSSCSVYGNIKTLPVTEEVELPEAESPYAHTKQMGEEMVKSFTKYTPEFKSVLLRYFNPAGAHPSAKIGELPLGPPTSLVPVITRTAAGLIPKMYVHGGDYETRDGSCIRDYIHVSDIADAHIKALDFVLKGKNREACSLFNLGTGNGITVFEAIKSFEKVSGKKLNYEVGPRRSGDVVAIYANNDLARKELGWQPKYGLDDMMLSAWKWQQHISTITAK